MYKIYENFFNEEQYNGINEYSIIAFQSQNLSSNMIWDYSVVKDSNAILTHVIDDKVFLSKIKERLDAVADDFNIKSYNTEIRLYYHTPLSHIPWHTDVDVKDKTKNIVVITCYLLNEKWDRDYGGGTIVEDEEELKAFYPEPNKAFVVEGGTYHTVFPLTTTAKIRRSIRIKMVEL